MSESISTFLTERIAANDFPSAVYLVAEEGKVVFQDALGLAVVEPERIGAKIDTIYDLASLTKPLVTGLLLAKAVDDEAVVIGDPLGRYLEGSTDDRLTIIRLATHTSGFPAWKPFRLCVDKPEEIVPHILATRREAGNSVVYSDLNFILLGRLIEKLFGTTLDRAFAERIAEPLGLQATRFLPPREWRPRIAASEKGNEHERRTAEEQSPDIDTSPSALRTDPIWGEVHDGNAFFMGGVAGHAGLFSTAEEIRKIALQFLPGHTRLLKPDTCRLFTTNFTPRMNEHRSFAFQLASTELSTAGPRMSPESFGHLGFTGTSLWIDPVQDRIFVLLTNRTHGHPLPFVNINSVRRRFHDLAIEELEKR